MDQDLKTKVSESLQEVASQLVNACGPDELNHLARTLVLTASGLFMEAAEYDGVAEATYEPEEE